MVPYVSGGRGLSVAMLGIAALLGIPAAASAMTVTVGSPLTASFHRAIAGGVFTNANASLTEPGANATSPIDGVIVRWRIADASGGPFSLRVLAPAGGGQYTGAGTSAPETPTNTGVQTFTTHLSIAAGQTIAFDNGSSSAAIGVASTGGSLIGWNPPLADGATRSPNESASGEFAFNADVQPPPGVSAVRPSSGPVGGGTSVVIAGHDFTGATAVAFGATAAAHFTVDSDGQITASAPAHGASGTVDVSVTTAAGKSSSTPADRYTYAFSCVVPKLKGKTLPIARKRLGAAHCTLGTVKKPKHGGGALIVKSQSPSTGTVLADGAPVSLKLVRRGQPKPPHGIGPRTRSHAHSYQ